MRMIETMFTEWQRKCVPVTAGPVQRQETERAFYAGAFSVFALVERIGDLSEAKGIAAMHNLETELTDYFRLMKTMPPGTEGNRQ